MENYAFYVRSDVMSILQMFIRTWAILIIHVPLQNDDIIIGGDFEYVLDTTPDYYTIN